MKMIAVEEHFSTKEHLDMFRQIVEKTYPNSKIIEEELSLHLEFPFFAESREIERNKFLEIGEERIRQMDEAGINMQVLSLISPGVQIFEEDKANSLAKKINDLLSSVVKKFPDRFAGFASIAPQDPAAAAVELERAVKELGLKGVSINSHTKGEYLDEKKYWVILEMAEKLDVPIYLHPRSPAPNMISPYLAYPVMASAMCGYAHEVSLHALRLICSGVFDVYPRLKFVLGHLGEALPFWLWRLDNMFLRRPMAKGFKKTPSEYFKDNFFITTSGLFWQPPLLCSYLALGADNILFAVDSPIESSKDAVDFMKSLPISKRDKEKICHLNAEKLFAL